MRKLLLSTILVIGLLLPSFGQVKIKLGHIDSMELLQSMPGRDSAQKVLESFSKILENQFAAMQKELETKGQEYQTNGATWNQSILQVKQKDLQDLQARIEAFQQSAQKDLKAKESELLKPIIDKAKKAIEETAKENGYTYIFDSSVGVLLYSESSDDIMLLVKKKLKITK
ncbi:MAG: OmpH family outer membrane protein [Bacteroidota bacterium]|jgi:outer membrane protein